VPASQWSRSVDAGDAGAIVLRTIKPILQLGQRVPILEVPGIQSRSRHCQTRIQG
jgi:hypothetical protein